MARINSIVGQKIVIYNKENKILLLKRTMTNVLPGTWDLPGGGIELHEDAVASLQREILEETGLSVKDITLVHTAAKTYPNDVHIFFVGYRGLLDSSTDVVLSHEHEEHIWIEPRDIAIYQLPPHWEDTVKKTIT